VKEFDLSNLLRSSETVRRTYRSKRNVDGSFRIEIEGLHTRESFEAVLVFIDTGDGDEIKTSSESDEDWIKAFRRRLVDVQLRKISGASHFELEDMIAGAETEYNSFVKRVGLNKDVGAPKWTLDRDSVGSSCGVAHFLSEIRCALRIHNRATSTSTRYAPENTVMDRSSHELAKALNILVLSNHTNKSTTRDKLGNHFKIASMLTATTNSSPPRVSSRVAKAMAREYESVRSTMKNNLTPPPPSSSSSSHISSHVARAMAREYESVRHRREMTYDDESVVLAKKTPTKNIQDALKEKYEQAEKIMLSNITEEKHYIRNRTPSKRVQQVLKDRYKCAEKEFGVPPGLENSVKKAKRRPLEMSDLFGAREQQEQQQNVEKEYFPDHMFGKSPAKKPKSPLQKRFDQELKRKEDSKYTSHLKEELNILDTFRRDATNNAMGRKIRINDIVEELEIAKEQLSAPKRQDDDLSLPEEVEIDEDEMQSMSLLLSANSTNFNEQEDEEEDLTLRPLPRHCVTESFQRVPTPKKKKRNHHHRKSSSKRKHKQRQHKPLLLRSTLVKVLEDASDLLEADFMMLKASETRLSFEDFEEIVSNHVPLDHASLRELFEISDVDADGTVNQWEFLNMIRHSKSGKIHAMSKATNPPPTPPASPDIRRRFISGQHSLDLSRGNVPESIESHVDSLEYRAATGDSEAGQELARRRIRERNRKEKKLKKNSTNKSTAKNRTINRISTNTPQLRARERARRVLRDNRQKKIDLEDEERKREERLRVLEMKAVRAREAAWAARRDRFSSQQDEIDRREEEEEEPMEVSFEIEKARRRAQQRAQRRVREMKQREQEQDEAEERRRQARFEARDRRLEAFRKRIHQETNEEEQLDVDVDDDADSLDRSVRWSAKR
jgi:hypothetical protein